MWGMLEIFVNLLVKIFYNFLLFFSSFVGMVDGFVSFVGIYFLYFFFDVFVFIFL